MGLDRFEEFSLVFYRLDEACVDNFGSMCSPAKQLWQFVYRLFKKLFGNFLEAWQGDTKGQATAILTLVE
jgi:hypothetical protein